MNVETRLVLVARRWCQKLVVHTQMLEEKMGNGIAIHRTAGHDRVLEVSRNEVAWVARGGRC